MDKTYFETSTGIYVEKVRVKESGKVSVKYSKEPVTIELHNDSPKLAAKVLLKLGIECEVTEKNSNIYMLVNKSNGLPVSSMSCGGVPMFSHGSELVTGTEKRMQRIANEINAFRGSEILKVKQLTKHFKTLSEYAN